MPERVLHSLIQFNICLCVVVVFSSLFFISLQSMRESLIRIFRSSSTTTKHIWDIELFAAAGVYTVFFYASIQLENNSFRIFTRISTQFLKLSSWHTHTHIRDLLCRDVFLILSRCLLSFYLFFCVEKEFQKHIHAVNASKSTWNICSKW